MSDQNLITIEDVVSMLGFTSTSSVRSLVARRELKVAARGSRYKAFFLRSDVLALMRERAAFYLRQRSVNENGASNVQE